MRILIADDNTQIVSILEKYAKKEGYDVVSAYDGKEALEKAFLFPYDILLLDVMMPHKDGFEVCKEVRKHSGVPIIMITAKGEDYEKIMGLDIGADDYIVKPFSPKEVMARIRAVTRRMSTYTPAEVFKYGSLMIRLSEYRTLVNGAEIILTKKEIELLWTLAKQRNKVFSRDELLNQIWGYDYYGEARAVDTHIKRLRAKLEKVPHPDWGIKTIWGVGYKFEGTNEE
jgi:DNA-binding response OmpR family regulator